MENNNIAIGCDHGGLLLKGKIIEHLKERGFMVTDFGCDTAESCDYPDYAVLVAKAVAKGDYERGVLICGTGIGDRKSVV